jgi:3-hydroxy acid dehydrogenase/malonic semialdehyde reductase
MPPLTSTAKNLHGKTILITGASSGIGRSTAFEFARTSPQSLNLILTARRLDRLHAISAQITAEVGSGVHICVHQLDVSRPEEIASLIENLPAEFKDVDVLVNNAYV